VDKSYSHRVGPGSKREREVESGSQYFLRVT
jgi:hypothetical protein